jgi:hypothetical protein
MLSCGANVVILLFGANVIIWCIHVMLSSGMITPPFLFFLKTSLTPSKELVTEFVQVLNESLKSRRHVLLGPVEHTKHSTLRY